MTLETSLDRLIGALDGAATPYMLSGSMASSFYGISRTTRDMDLVIDPNPEQFTRLIRNLEAASFYISEPVARSAFQRRFQFKVIDMQNAWKADLILEKDRPFSRMEFSRRCREHVLGVDLWLSSPEDTILAK